MKIGINGRFLTLPYTGIGQYTAHLLHALAEQDSSVEYVVAIPSPLSTSNKAATFPPNIRLILLPEKKFIPARLRKIVWEQIQVPHLFKKEKVDLAHYPYPANPRFPGCNAPKTIVTVHDVIPWIDPKHYQPRLCSRLLHSYMKKALPKADHLICVSQTTAMALSDHIQYPWGKITVIHEAASPIFNAMLNVKKESLNSENSKKKDTESLRSLCLPYFLYVGGYDARKNVLRLVEAFNAYIAPTHQVDLVLVGAKNLDNPYYTELKSLQEILEASTIKRPSNPFLGKIRTTGYLSPETLAQYLQNALGFVNFSLEEGFNLPLLEAAAVGTPILTSDIAIHREILGESALFCDPKNIKSMGETLVHFLRDSALQERLSQAAHDLSSRYSWERAAQETLAIYRQLAH